MFEFQVHSLHHQSGQEYSELIMTRGMMNGTAAILLDHRDPLLTPSWQHVRSGNLRFTAAGHR